MVTELPRLGKRELICLLLFTCGYVVSVWRGFLFLWVLGVGYLILLLQSLSLPFNYFSFMVSSPNVNYVKPQFFVIYDIFFHLTLWKHKRFSVQQTAAATLASKQVRLVSAKHM